MRVLVGEGSCGIATGAKKTAAELEKQIKEKGISAEVEITGCVGNCYLEPIVDVYDDEDRLTRYIKVQPENVTEIVDNHLAAGRISEDMTISEKDKEFIEKQKRIVLRNAERINPEKIEEYIAKEGYKAAEKAVTSMTPEEVIEEVKISGLRGRGGSRLCEGGYRRRFHLYHQRTKRHRKGTGQCCYGCGRSKKQILRRNRDICAHMLRRRDSI